MRVALGIFVRVPDNAVYTHEAIPLKYGRIANKEANEAKEKTRRRAKAAGPVHKKHRGVDGENARRSAPPTEGGG
jgi:hypothetical protein